jgi:excisionase family DNA binding protein
MRDEREFQRATYTIAEAAKKLGIGKNSAYEAAKRGDIPVVKVGKRLLVPSVAFDQMLAGK